MWAVQPRLPTGRPKLASCRQNGGHGGRHLGPPPPQLTGNHVTLAAKDVLVVFFPSREVAHGLKKYTNSLKLQRKVIKKKF